MKQKRRYNKKVDYLEGSGLYSAIKNALTGTISRVVNKVLPLRKAGVLPPDVRKWLSENGDKLVVKMMIVRVPIAKYVNTLLQAITLGKFKQALSKTGYDGAIHLRLQFDLEDNTSWYIEKNEIIEIKRYQGKSENQTDMEVEYAGNLTMNEILAKTREFLGDEAFTTYQSFGWNCQHFVSSILQANDLLKPEYKTFIMQDAKAIFDNLPSYTRGVSQNITDFAARLNRFMKGEGKKKKKKINKYSNNNNRMMNEWQKHVAEVRKANPSLSYKDALIAAKSSYKKQSGKGVVLAGKQQTGRRVMSASQVPEEMKTLMQQLVGNIFEKQKGQGVVLAGRNAPLRRIRKPVAETAPLPLPVSMNGDKPSQEGKAKRTIMTKPPTLRVSATPPVVSFTQVPSNNFVKGLNNFPTEKVKLPVSNKAFPNLGSYASLLA